MFIVTGDLVEMLEPERERERQSEREKGGRKLWREFIVALIESV